MSRPLRFRFACLALLGMAALASSTPAVRWCPLPWRSITLADYLACDAGADRCATTCAERVESVAGTCAAPCKAKGSCDAPGAAWPGADPPREDPGRAYCLEAPGSATFAGPGADPGPPTPAAALAREAPLLPPPRARPPRFLAGESPPPNPPPVSLPPVRGPPFVA